MIPVLCNLFSESIGNIKFWDTVEDSNIGGPSSVTVRMEYLFTFQLWSLCGKPIMGRQKVLFFGGTLIVGGWGAVEWGRKSYFGPVEIVSFSNRDFSRNNKHDTFWYVVSTGYFCLIFVSHCYFRFSSLGNL